MPVESFDVVNSLIKCFSVVVGDVKVHPLSVSVVNDEALVKLGVKLHMGRNKVDRVGLDGVSAVLGDKDDLVVGVGEHVVTIVMRMVEKLVDGGGRIVFELELVTDVSE